MSIVLSTTLTLATNQAATHYIVVFFVAFLISIGLTPLMRVLAIKNGIVDRPDAERKNHRAPIAYLGGVAIFLAWLGGIFTSYFITPHTQSTGQPPINYVDFPIPVVIGAIVVALTGLLDDVYHLRPRFKIGGQFIAAAALAWSGQNLGTQLMVDSFAAIGMELPSLLAYVLGAGLIALFVIGGCNSMNLLDGLDGLAAGVAAIACLGFLFLANYAAMSVVGLPAEFTADRVVYDPVRLVMCLAVLGALLGFLPYNFNPANIFMGDTGSLLLGYLCVTTILLFAQIPTLVLAGLVIFTLPIADSTLAIFRRRLRGQPIFSPDSKHLHHQILLVIQKLNLGANVSVKLAVLVMYFIAAVFAVIGSALVYLGKWYLLPVFVVLFGFIVVNGYKSGRRSASQGVASH